MFAQRCRRTSAKHDYIASAVRGNMLASAVCARSCCGHVTKYQNPPVDAGLGYLWTEFFVNSNISNFDSL